MLAARASFERALAEELAKVRAQKRQLDAAKYQEPGASHDPSLTHLAVSASRHPDILDAERMLDAARWEWLEAHGLGHYLDAQALRLYALKLLILERWQRIRVADKEAILQKFEV
jgi:hypothetical protein